MQLMRAKIFSMLMACVMLTTSVGITTKVHFCMMKYEKATTSCCKHNAEEDTDCCEEKTGITQKQNNCCVEVINSVALSTEYSGKFESAKNFFISPLFLKSHSENLKSLLLITETLVSEIKQPPKIFCNNLIYFLQVIKV